MSDKHWHKYINIQQLWRKMFQRIMLNRNASLDKYLLFHQTLASTLDSSFFIIVNIVHMQPKPCVTEQFNKRVNFRANKSCFFSVFIHFYAINAVENDCVALWFCSLSHIQNQRKFTRGGKKTHASKYEEWEAEETIPCYLFKYGVGTWAWAYKHTHTYYIVAQFFFAVRLFIHTLHKKSLNEYIVISFFAFTLE